VNGVAEHQPHLGPAHQWNLQFEFIGQPGIVRVDKSYQFPSCVTKRAITRNVRSGMRLTDNLRWWAEAFDYVARTVGGAVINHNQFEVAISLGQHTLDSSGYGRLPVMDGHDN
jgi:hypothetical protein